MVDTPSEKTAFVLRFKEALKDNEIDGHGAGVLVADELKRRGGKASPQAVNKWMNGDSMPRAQNMRILCEWLKVRQAWLEYGEQPKRVIESFELTEVREHQPRYGNGISIENLSTPQQEALIQLRMAFVWGYMSDDDARSLLDEIRRKRLEKGIGTANI